MALTVADVFWCIAQLLWELARSTCHTRSHNPTCSHLCQSPTPLHPFVPTRHAHAHPAIPPTRTCAGVTMQHARSACALYCRPCPFARSHLLVPTCLSPTPAVQTHVYLPRLPVRACVHGRVANDAMRMICASVVPLPSRLQVARLQRPAPYLCSAG